MKKWKSLRGRGVIHQLRRNGSVLRGELVQCSVQIHRSESPGIRAGFIVARKSISAVCRNRLKRLMREAFRKEQDTLFGALTEQKLQASILFSFKGKKGRNVAHTSFNDVHEEVAKFARAVVLKL